MGHQYRSQYRQRTQGQSPPTCQCLVERCHCTAPWPHPEVYTDYGNGSLYRSWLEQTVGIGLGTFDLVVIDEAHKGRGSGGGLSRLLGMLCGAPDCRRLCLTATPWN